MSHITPSESRLMARARLSQVLSEKRDEDTKAQIEFEQTRAIQIEHVLSLKLNIAAEQNREHEIDEMRKRKKRQKQQSLQALRADLEARGINADAVILEQEEYARQEKERKARVERDQANTVALQKQLAREDAMRRQMLSREVTRHAQGEALRKKVSRNLIEVSVEQLKRKKARQADSVKQHEYKEEQILDRDDNSSSAKADDDISITDQADHDSVQELSSFDPAASDSSPKEPRSYSLIAPITHLQHYQQQAHRTKLAERLNDSIYHHQHRERQPIMGKTYQSSPFVATPTTVAFIDIEQNISQSITLTITNTSFTFTNVQLMPLSGQLAECCKVEFTPPGRLSSGQSFNVKVTLTPTIEREMMGSIDFISECGPFSVPMTASMRKAVISIDRQEVMLRSVLGDHDRAVVKLRNDGARAVNFVHSFVNCRHVRPADDQDDEIILSYQPISVGISSISRPDTVALQSILQNDAATDQLLSASSAEQQPAGVTASSSSTIGDNAPLESSLHAEQSVTAYTMQPMAQKRIHRLEAYSELSLIVHFKPRFAASTTMQLLIECSDPDQPKESSDPSSLEQPVSSTPIVWGSSCSLSASISAEGVDVPVYVTDPLLSFGACVSDKLYRSSVKLNNRSNQAHRFTMMCSSALNPLISFLPVVGYVQPHDSIDVQVKLRVPITHEDQVYHLLEQAGITVDPEDQAKGIIVVPMVIDVNGQTLPIHWTLKARLTTSLISISHDEHIQHPTHLRAAHTTYSPATNGPFSPRAMLPETPVRLNFGAVIVGQSGSIVVKVTNHSILMQKVSFIGLPTYCSVITNASEIDDPGCNEVIEQGLINLMPLRSYSINILFTPTKATKHHWTFTLKSSLNQIVQIECRGNGAKCPVAVDRSRIAMRAVCEGDVDISNFWVTNTSNQTKLVHFMPPSDQNSNATPELCDRTNDRRSFLSFHPSVLSLDAGSSSRVQVQFRPLFNSERAVVAKAPLASTLPLEDSEQSKLPNKVDSKADKPVVQPPKKGKGKKIDAAEQARLDEQARVLEEQRVAEETRIAEEQRIAQEKVEAERVYNSAEARQARQRANPVNQLVDCSLIEWNDTDTREPYSRRGRHRIAVCVQAAKRPSKLPQIDSAPHPAEIADQMQNDTDPPSHLAGPPLIDTNAGESTGSVVLTSAPKFSVFFMQISTCITNSPLLLSFGPASPRSHRPSYGALNFGPMALNNAAVRTITVTNVSSMSQVVSLTGLQNTSPFRFVGQCVELFIEPRQTISHTFSFTPVLEQTFESLAHFVCKPILDERTNRSTSLSSQRSTATNTSSFNDPALHQLPLEVRVPLTLVGQGVNPTFKLSHQKFAFVCLSVNQSITQTVTITNTSPYPLHLTLALSNTKSSDLNVGRQPAFQWSCSDRIVEPGQSTPVQITFTPDIMSLRFYADLTINQSVIELHGVCSTIPLFMVAEHDRHQPRIDLSPTGKLVTGRRFMDALREPEMEYQSLALSDAAFKPEPVEKPAKAAKGKNDKQDKTDLISAAPTNQSKLLPMFSKFSLYDFAVLPASEQPWLVRFPYNANHDVADTSIISFHFSTGSGVDEKLSSGSFECLTGKMDVLDEFFAVSQSTSSIKPGESVSLTLSFDRRKFVEWRQGTGKQLWDQSISHCLGMSRPFVESIARVTLRYQSGEKGAQPNVNTQLIALRADVQ